MASGVASRDARLGSSVCRSTVSQMGRRPSFSQPSHADGAFLILFSRTGLLQEAFRASEMPLSKQGCNWLMCAHVRSIPMVVLSVRLSFSIAFDKHWCSGTKGANTMCIESYRRRNRDLMTHFNRQTSLTLVKLRRSSRETQENPWYDS